VTFDRGSKRSFNLFPKPGDFLLRMVFNEKGVAVLRSGWNSACGERTTGGSEKYPKGTMVDRSKVAASTSALTTLLWIQMTA